MSNDNNPKSEKKAAYGSKFSFASAIDKDDDDEWVGESASKTTVSKEIDEDEEESLEK